MTLWKVAAVAAIRLLETHRLVSINGLISDLPMQWLTREYDLRHVRLDPFEALTDPGGGIKEPHLFLNRAK